MSSRCWPRPSRRRRSARRALPRSRPSSTLPRRSRRRTRGRAARSVAAAAPPRLPAPERSTSSSPRRSTRRSPSIATSSSRTPRSSSRRSRTTACRARSRTSCPGPTVTTYEVSPAAGHQGLQGRGARRRSRARARAQGAHRRAHPGQEPHRLRAPERAAACRSMLRDLVEDRRFQALDVPLPVRARARHPRQPRLRGPREHAARHRRGRDRRRQERRAQRDARCRSSTGGRPTSCGS